MALSAPKLPATDSGMAGRSLRLAYAGGEPPARPRARAVDNGVLGMAIFLGTETMLFAGLISAFLILRAGSGAWPPLDQPRLPVFLTGINTLVLLASAYTMQRAASASRAAQHLRLTRWLAVTAALGTTFLVVQGSEWVRLLGYGLRASSSLYGGTFYTLIGCHGLHVLAAVIALVALLVRAVRGEGSGPRRSEVDTCQLYWLFVVAVWPVLYVLVYLT
jgi:heme/copper-type cytochrome/quinol oxidase subunit 3